MCVCVCVYVCPILQKLSQAKKFAVFSHVAVHVVYIPLFPGQLFQLSSSVAQPSFLSPMLPY